MRHDLKRSIVAIGVAAVILMLWSTTRSVIGQSRTGQIPTTYKAPRTADGQPDLNGFWQALNTANWDIEEHGTRPAPFENLVGAYLAQPAGLSVVEGGEIPYKPEALAQRKKNFETRLAPDPYKANDEWPVADPEAKCFAAGVPRATYIGLPFQILQSKNEILIAYEFAGTPRVVFLGEVNPLIFYGVDTWMGQSKGRWEGDTLVVEVQGFSGKPWLDRAGNFLTEKGKVVERYTPISPYHLMYEATIEDPSIFTRSWKMSMPLYRRIEPNTRLLEFQCIEFAEEFLYGKYKKGPSK